MKQLTITLTLLVVLVFAIAPAGLGDHGQKQPSPKPQSADSGANDVQDHRVDEGTRSPVSQSERPLTISGSTPGVVEVDQLVREHQLGFKTLFDGVSFAGWEHGGNWEIRSGAFYRARKGGPLTYTARTVPDDFELRFEWRVTRGCNSGVYYRPGQVEYQILDNVHSPYGENPRQAAASLFFCMAPSVDATLPHGQWNTGRILCKGSVIEHWLNGKCVISFDYNDPKWAEQVRLLGIRGGDLTGRGGRLWLQDHGQSVWFRNLRWREIPADETITPDPMFQPMPIPPEALEKERARVERMLKQQ